MSTRVHIYTYTSGLIYTFTYIHVFTSIWIHVYKKPPPNHKTWWWPKQYKTISIDVGIAYVEAGVRNSCSRYDHWPVRVRKTIFKCCLICRGNQRIMDFQILYDQTAIDYQLCIYYWIQCSIWSVKAIEDTLITFASCVSELNRTGYCSLRCKTISLHWKVHVVLYIINGWTFYVIWLRLYFQFRLKTFSVIQNVVFTTRS